MVAVPGQFISYYGAKWNVAKKLYPAPKYDIIIEPFAGGAGYSNRYYDKKVHLNDLNPKVVEVWRYLIRTSEEEIMRLPLVFDDVRDTNICQEAKWFIGFWLNSGSANPKNLPSGRMKSGRRPNCYWGPSLRERIAREVQYIRHWTVSCVDYRQMDTPEAVWFIDPPYEGRAGSYYPVNTVDYIGLADWVKSLKGQVIVCENEGATWLPFVPLATIPSNRRNKLKENSKEAVYLQG